MWKDYNFLPDSSYDFCPSAIRYSMFLYIEKGQPTGDFLKAVLSNDLKESFARADDGNRVQLFNIVSWLYNYAPAACWGSPERYKKWINTHPSKKETNL